jgi:hypothetical protein
VGADGTSGEACTASGEACTASGEAWAGTGDADAPAESTAKTATNPSAPPAIESATLLGKRLRIGKRADLGPSLPQPDSTTTLSAKD